ncbi:hypothetical protein [Mycobacterium sp. OTB74]|uniref:hypothetical protein n=1 Tax=Mycobacterium sp. OTB74 TaxID=1853452 RepID=UPI00247532CA|nr:hypothetical protein [Mycobacterium sp. OTB74]MDH6244938.1 hypothetical protein [Mycobacterium sp. OTB74]
MSISFPFKFVDLGTPLPFKIEANPDFPAEMEPVCILSNLGLPPGRDTYITVGDEAPPNGPDPWELTFHWATTGGPAAGSWQLDAFLQSLTGPIPNITVPHFPKIVSGVNPQKYDESVIVPPIGGSIPAPGIFLCRLFATLRWRSIGTPPVVRIAGRADGPLIEFYKPV